MKRLERELRLGAAVMLGLGSFVGAGVFVSIGIAAGIAGPAMLIGIIAAALVATCNGLSSAQLAAAAVHFGHPFVVIAVAILITGFVGCLSLSVFVDPVILFIGFGLIIAGLLWHLIAGKIKQEESHE